MISILHLSDIHLGTKDIATKYLTQLKIDLKKQLNTHKLNYLVVSGDIANLSIPDEYDAAILLFEGIINQFELNRNHVIVTPGNHDLNWKISENSYKYIPKHKVPDTLDEKYITLGENGALKRDKELYKQRFKNFNDYFYEKLFGKQYPFDYIDQGLIFYNEDILFLSLNSCWEIDHHFTDRVSINMESLSKSLNEVSNFSSENLIKIAIWHHPVAGTQMMNDDFLELLSISGFNICLHGHIHETKKSFYNYDDNYGIHIIGAGTFGAPVNELNPGIPYQYNFLKYDPDKDNIIVETRKKEKTNGAWAADARWGDRNNPEPRYIITNLKNQKKMVNKDYQLDDETLVVSIFKNAFSKISNYRFNELIEGYKYKEIKYFQNRSRSIQAIDDFLRSDKTILVLRGSPYIGKNSLVSIALEKIEHNRLPIEIDVKVGIDIVQIIEQIATNLNICHHIDVEQLSKLKTIPTKKLKQEFMKSINKITFKSILLIDNFEDIIDQKGNIENEDVEWLLNVWSDNKTAKIIIKTRFKLNSLLNHSYTYSEYITNFKSSSEGRFGKHLYIVQMLQSLIPIEFRVSDEQFGGIPERLLDALDNHPYFAYLSHLIIKNNEHNTLCLKNEDFIDNLIYQLNQNLLSSFNLNTTEKKIIYALSLVRTSFPIDIVNSVTKNNDLSKRLLNKGLLLKVSHNLFRTFKLLRNKKNFNEHIDNNQDKIKWHTLFATEFSKLYKNESKKNPSYYREAYYHTTLAEKKKNITAYNLPEITDCTNDWFKYKNYDDVSWALQEIGKYRQLSSHEKMRLASCELRLYRIDKGKKLYKQLFNKYPDWNGVRYSFVDSLLYIRGYVDIGDYVEDALEELNSIPIYKRERNSIWHQKAARCYRVLLKKSEAYDHYEKAYINATWRDTWNFIIEFINYAKKIGDTKKEEELLLYTWDTIKIRTDEVKIQIGAYFERINKIKEAETVLKDVFRKNPKNAYAVLPLIKTLCKSNKIAEAKEILDNSKKDVSPKEIFMYAQIFYLRKLGKFDECEHLIKNTHYDSRLLSHRYWQWADFFLAWSIEKSDIQDKVDIAEQGLKYVEKTIDNGNVPAMLVCLELSKISNNTKLKTKIEEAVKRINIDLVI